MISNLKANVDTTKIIFIALSFWFIGISQAENKSNKILNIEFWVVSTYAIKIWDYLNEN